MSLLVGLRASSRSPPIEAAINRPGQARLGRQAAPAFPTRDSRLYGNENTLCQCRVCDRVSLA
jgi:hypothetical protein